MSGAGRRVEVAVAGAGPAGLVLANVLRRAGIEVAVWERFSAAHLERRARAGLLEHRIAGYLRAQGLATGLDARGSRHGWCEFACLGRLVRVDYRALTGGAGHWVYPQQELVGDLLAELARAGGPARLESPVLGVGRDGTGRPVLRVAEGGAERTYGCEYLVGCDGAHGIVAECFPPQARRVVRRRYPYDWLTVLAEVSRPVEGVRYALHESGFAGMMPRAGTVGRLYLQVPPEDDPARWPAERVQAELAARLRPAPGDPRVLRLLETGVVRLHARVRGRLRHGRVFLAGDAAHLLTPSGAKGLNLAVADAADLADALIRALRRGDPSALDGYEARRLRETWRMQEFSDRLLGLLHLPREAAEPAEREFGLRLRLAHLRGLAEPGPRAVDFARDYAGAGEVRLAPPP
ncbi:FAD-dependent monooxygenase [Streptomyces hoynatensis]|uniref:Hydroxybenzoate hydroxylase n=1 Tax=Streptomyces hoynatensis TaxID=1141874 RepID=A0A3A9ZBE2_9ACTN|nr:FAD-dependent monooxygenase [Streptomyces hoynatensis]RKN45598.1 hydroxybenzoate hydroxylase [Streptomyces hoynatensis]